MCYSDSTVIRQYCPQHLNQDPTNRLSLANRAGLAMVPMFIKSAEKPKSTVDLKQSTPNLMFSNIFRATAAKDLPLTAPGREQMYSHDKSIKLACN